MKFFKFIIEHQIQPTNQNKMHHPPPSKKNPIQTQKAIKKTGLEFYHKIKAGNENNSAVFNPCKRKFC